ncbi:GDSL-type esterase/lipase family protein, partial [Nocardia gipuzkoensis]
AVTPDTDLVTVTIGGNDLGLIGGMIADSCPAIAGDAPALRDPASKICSAALGHRNDPAPADFAEVRHALGEIVRRVHEIAPAATVLLVEYLPALDARVDTCAAVPLAEHDARAARRIWEGLIASTHAAAEQQGATSVAVPEAEAHTACAADPWIGGFHNPLTRGPLSLASSYHPTEAGMAAVAARLGDLVRAD